MDKVKLLEYVNYGIERSEVIQEGAFQAKNDNLYFQMVGGRQVLKTLLEQIELGTFDSSLESSQSVEQALREYSGDNTYDGVISWLESTTNFKLES